MSVSSGSLARLTIGLDSDLTVLVDQREMGLERGHSEVTVYTWKDSTKP